MHEEVNQKVVSLGIRTGKLTANVLAKAMKMFLDAQKQKSHQYNRDAAVDASLERLGVDYIDLMILHHSQPSNDVDAYQPLAGRQQCGQT